MATMPSVRYRGHADQRRRCSRSTTPRDMPDPARIAEIDEPFIDASRSSCRRSTSATIMELCQERRGDVRAACTTSPPTACSSPTTCPLAEIVLDFFDQLKSRTRGYASLDYEFIGLPRRRDLVKLDVLLAGEPVDALSLIVHKRQGLRPRGATLAEKLRKKIPRQQFDVPIQAAIGSQDHRPRDGQGLPQGRHRQVLRRRHHPQAQAAREAEGRQEAHEAGRHASRCPRRPSWRCSSSATKAERLGAAGWRGGSGAGRGGGRASGELVVVV